MVKKKGKSKRISMKDKYKVKRRVVEKHRKDRKQAKKDAKNGVIRNSHISKKDPGIPNSWPFKQELLQEIANDRERENERKLNNNNNQSGGGRTLEDMMNEVAQKHKDFAATTAELLQRQNIQQNSNDGFTISTDQKRHGQQSRRAYLRECKKVLDSSDVILQILDARDPLGTRISRIMEEAILSRYDKKMVLVLNKVDLIPKAQVSEWLTYLRKSHPTLAMKAGTSSSSNNKIGQAKGDGALQSGSAVGVEAILQLLKNYSRNGDTKGCITVGVLGYPNVGKSSLINSLKRARAVGVSARPGFTTSMQEVVLDKNIRLLDCPGVVFDDSVDSAGCDGAVLLRNCVDIDTVPDPLPAIEELVKRCTRESLMMTYAIPAFPENNADIFLSMIAKKFGKIKQGGILNKVAAARAVLKDWNEGKIPYYTPVPKTNKLDADDGMAVDGDSSSGQSSLGNPVILSSFGEEFDVELMKSLNEDGDSSDDEMDYVELKPSSDDTKQSGSGCKDAINILTGQDPEGSNNNDMQIEGQKAKPGIDNATMEEADDYDFSA